MDLYKLHAKPKSLRGFGKSKFSIPEIAWAAAKTPADKRKLSSLWAKSAEYAFLYASEVLKGRFPEGEDVLAKDVFYAGRYAVDAIKGRFPEGEPIIAQSPNVYAGRYYAEYALNDRDPNTWAERYRKEHGLA